MENTPTVSGPARVAHVQGIPVIEVSGRLDTNNASAFDAQTAVLSGESCARVLLDLSATTYISSAGLRSILKIIKLVAGRGGRVGVFSAAPQIQEILEISGFQSLMDVHPDRETAIKLCQAS